MTTRTELRRIVNQEQSRLKRNSKARDRYAERTAEKKADKIVREFVKEAFKDIDAKMVAAAKKGKNHLILIRLSETEESNDPDYSGFSGSRRHRHAHATKISQALEVRAKRKGLKTKIMSIKSTGMFGVDAAGLCIVWGKS